MSRFIHRAPVVRAGHNVVLTAAVISVSIAKAGGLSPQIPPVDTAPAVPPAAQVEGFAVHCKARHKWSGFNKARIGDVGIGLYARHAPKLIKCASVKDPVSVCRKTVG